jgi:hypothetical protein
MIRQLLGTLLLLSAVEAVPTRWRSATVKRGAADLEAKYDYIIGKLPHSRFVRNLLTSRSGRGDGRHNFRRPALRGRNKYESTLIDALQKRG